MNLPIPKPLVYLITNRHAFPRNDDQFEAIHRAAKSGCQLIQIREKDLPPRELCDFVRQAIATARPFGARVLVNDRVDIALAAKADGVHLRSDSLSATDVRSLGAGLVPAEFLIGVSTHTKQQARQAESDGADFIVFGPIYDTHSKREYGSPLGADRLTEICRALRIPVLAIGGIHRTNVRATLDCGAAGIAAIGLFTDPAEIEDNVRLVLQTVD